MTSSESVPNKFMYINQQFMNNLKPGTSRVLINPNFVPPPVVKPHFNKSFFQNRTVLVNPNVIKQSVVHTTVQTLGTISTAVTSLQASITSSQTVQSRIPSSRSTSKTAILSLQTTAPSFAASKATFSQCANTNNVVISTRTKLIRVCKPQPPQPNAVNTRFKKINPSISNCDTKKVCIKKKTQFKLDNRFNVTKTKPKQKILNSRLKFTLNKNGQSRMKWKKSYYININGVLYKKNSKPLSLVNRKIKKNVKRKVQLLTIRGQKYKMDSNHRTLTLVSSTIAKVKPVVKAIRVEGFVFKQKQPNIFVRINPTKLKKSNIPCPVYRRFGRCKGKENGTCIRIHNPNQISLCSKFLQGACTIDNCLLSHKVSPEKMPTCKFFLEGLCLKDKCPYLHVKISSKADICTDFLEGFCKKAAECDKRHLHLCPKFEKGDCKKKKCPYPHGVNENRVRTNVFIKKLDQKVTNYKNLPTSISSKEDVNVNRYYDESKSNNKSEQNFNLFVNQRPKLGDLPSFIPFD